MLNSLNTGINTATLLAASTAARSTASTGPTLPKSHSMTPQQAENAGKDFESMFMGQMLEQMFGDSVGSQAFGDDDSGEIYKGLMMDAYGKEIGKSGGIGIADYVKRELLKLQET